MTVTTAQFTSLAVRIRDIIAAGMLAAGVTDVTVYDHEPYDFDPTCAITIDGPDFQRRGVDDADSQLGTRDWLLDWTVRVYVRDDDQEYPVQKLREVTAILIATIDNDSTLKGTGVSPGVIDAVFQDGQQFSAAVGSAAIRTLGIECSLHVFQLT